MDGSAESMTQDSGLAASAAATTSNTLQTMTEDSPTNSSCRLCDLISESPSNGTVGPTENIVLGPLLEDPYRSVVFSILAVFLAVGSSINFATIIMFVRNSMIRSATNMLVLNLTVSDFLISVICIPLMMGSLWNGKWVMGEKGCQLYMFTFLLLSAASIGSIAAIAVERYYSLTLPQTLDQKGTNIIVVYRTVGVIWLMSAVLSLPPFLGWSGVHLDTTTLVCGLEWRDDKFTHILYPVFYTTICIFAPLIVKTVFYYKLYNTIYTVSKNARYSRRSSVVQFALRVSRVSRRSSTCSTLSNSSALITNINSNLQSIEKQAQRKKKLASPMTFMVAVSFVTWCPFGVVSTVLVAANDVSPEWLVAAIILAKTCIFYNPLLYFAFNKKFRRMFIRTFTCNFSPNRIASASQVEVQPQSQRRRCYSHPGLYTISEMGSQTALPGSRFEKRASTNSSVGSSILDRGYRASYPDGSAEGRSAISTDELQRLKRLSRKKAVTENSGHSSLPH